jgi:hypothetical protein
MRERRMSVEHRVRQEETSEQDVRRVRVEKVREEDELSATVASDVPSGLSTSLLGER